MTEEDVERGVRFVCPCQLEPAVVPEGAPISVTDIEILTIHNDGRYCGHCDRSWVVCVRCGEVVDARDASSGGSAAFGTGHYCLQCTHENLTYHRGRCVKEDLEADLARRGGERITHHELETRCPHCGGVIP